MTLLALLALTDGRPVLAPHVLHHLGRLVEAGADVVVASRCELEAGAPGGPDDLSVGTVRFEVCPGADGAPALLGRALGVVRRDGPAAHGDVVLATDRVVGPFVDLDTALPPTRGEVVRAVVATGPGPDDAAVEVLRVPAGALRDPVVVALLQAGGPAAPARWSDLVDVLVAGGLELVPTYRPTPVDVLRTRARLLRHLASSPGGVESAPALLRLVRGADLRGGRELSEAALDGRLPYLALDALRRPAPGAPADLLARLEQRHPAALAGVREAA